MPRPCEPGTPKSTAPARLPNGGPRPVLPKQSPQARTDSFYNFNKPGHFAAQCAEPYRPRERRTPVIAVNAVTEDTKPTAESKSNESTDSKNECAWCPFAGCPAHHHQLVKDVKSQGF